MDVFFALRYRGEVGRVQVGREGEEDRRRSRRCPQLAGGLIPGGGGGGAGRPHRYCRLHLVPVYRLLVWSQAPPLSVPTVDPTPHYLATRAADESRPLPCAAIPLGICCNVSELQCYDWFSTSQWRTLLPDLHICNWRTACVFVCVLFWGLSPNWRGRDTFSYEININHLAMLFFCTHKLVFFCFVKSIRVKIKWKWVSSHLMPFTADCGTLHRGWGNFLLCNLHHVAIILIVLLPIAGWEGGWWQARGNCVLQWAARVIWIGVWRHTAFCSKLSYLLFRWPVLSGGSAGFTLPSPLLFPPRNAKKIGVGRFLFLYTSLIHCCYCDCLTVVLNFTAVICREVAFYAFFIFTYMQIKHMHLRTSRSLQPPNRFKLEGWFPIIQEPRSFNLTPEYSFLPGHGYRWFSRYRLTNSIPAFACLHLTFIGVNVVCCLCLQNVAHKNAWWKLTSRWAPPFTFMVFFCVPSHVPMTDPHCSGVSVVG